MRRAVWPAILEENRRPLFERGSRWQPSRPDDVQPVGAQIGEGGLEMKFKFGVGALVCVAAAALLSSTASASSGTLVITSNTLLTEDHEGAIVVQLVLEPRPCHVVDRHDLRRTRRPRHPSTEKPYRWSQRWYDDPPVGTIVLGHERVIYMGNGEWQPLGESVSAGLLPACPAIRSDPWPSLRTRPGLSHYRFRKPSRWIIMGDRRFGSRARSSRRFQTAADERDARRGRDSDGGRERT